MSNDCSESSYRRITEAIDAGSASGCRSSNGGRDLALQTDFIPIPRSARPGDSQNLSRAAIRGIQFLPFAPSALPPSASSFLFPLLSARFSFSFLSFFFKQSRIPAGNRSRRGMKWIWTAAVVHSYRRIQFPPFPSHLSCSLTERGVSVYRMVLDGWILSPLL